MHNGYPEWLMQACQVADEHPLRKAIYWTLDQAAQSDLAGVTNPECNDAQRHYMAGRLSAIQDMHEEWNTIFTEAHSGQVNP